MDGRLTGNNDDPGVVASQPGGGAVYQTSEGVIVRNMRADDSDFAGRLFVDAFRDKFIHAIGTNNIPLAHQAFAEDHRQAEYNYHRIFIAEYKGQRAGVMQLKFHGDRDNPEYQDLRSELGCWRGFRLSCLPVLTNVSVPRGHCYLDHICVSEGFRGKGIGKALMTVADQQAVANGCGTIYLWVTSDNRARNLYEREGYHVSESTTACCLAYCISGKRGFVKMVKRYQ